MERVQVLKCSSISGTLTIKIDSLAEMGIEQIRKSCVRLLQVIICEKKTDCLKINYSYSFTWLWFLAFVDGKRYLHFFQV